MAAEIASPADVKPLRRGVESASAQVAQVAPPTGGILVDQRHRVGMGRVAQLLSETVAGEVSVELTASAVEAEGGSVLAARVAKEGAGGVRRQEMEGERVGGMGGVGWRRTCGSRAQVGSRT